MDEVGPDFGRISVGVGLPWTYATDALRAHSKLERCARSTPPAPPFGRFGVHRRRHLSGTLDVRQWPDG